MIRLLSRTGFAALYFLCSALIPIGLPAGYAVAQTDSSNKVAILIQNADISTSVTGADNQMKLVGNVVLKQGENEMLCDTAIFNLVQNNVEAFGNVRLIQTGGALVESEYLRYTGNTKLAFLRGNVHLTNGKDALWTEELTYNTGTRVGTYEHGGTLQSEATTLSSNTGVYNLRTKDARFKGEVFVTDPRYQTISEDLGYNTGTKLVTFFGPSIVTNDKSELRTSRGTYDSQQEVGKFTSRSSIRNEAQYVEGDTLDYDRRSGVGLARGNVIALDTVQKTTLYAGRAAYNERTRTLLASVHPVLRKEQRADSIFIAADTFFSAPLAWLQQDTARKILAQPRIISPDAEPTSAPLADSSAPRFFIGYHHVLIWSDSLQGRCDSISYNQQDSVLRMMIKPVAWARNSQISGDTILLYTDSSAVNKIYIPNNALSISVSGPPTAGMYDQIQGRTLTAYLENNKIQRMEVFPEAESIYYATDDARRYLGVSQASAEVMHVYFEEDEVRTIKLIQGVKQTMTPMKDADFNTLRLSRFEWLEDIRPKSRDELFR